MEISKKLKRYYYLKVQIRRMEQEIAELRELAESVRGVRYEEKPGSSNRSYEAPFERLVFKIHAKEQKRLKALAQLYEQTDEVEALISGVEDERDKTILMFRYFDAKKFEEIAEELNYSVDRIYQLHREAIRRLEDERLQ